ncbi:MAG: YopX family protein [Desulfuromonadaceae bacterium]
MREIKFRAWDKRRGEYLSGGSVLISIEPGRRPKNNPIFLDILKDPDMFRDRFIIEQFTGIHETYDGDIVEAFEHGDSDRRVVLKVHWLNGCWMFGNWNAHEFLSRFRMVKVIGTIHNNPELLEVSNKEAPTHD